MIVVGLTSVRKAHPTSGFVVAGAGAIALLGSCCSNIPGILMRQGIGGSAIYEMSDVFTALNLLVTLATYGAIIGGMVMLANAIQKGATK